MSPTVACRVKSARHKGLKLQCERVGRQFFIGMLNVKVPLLVMCEFPSNFLFRNTEHVSSSKPIPLQCNGEPYTTL